MAVASGTRYPVRTCLGCGRKRAKSELVRLALNGKGEVVWDRQQKRPGRGAYLCASRDCLTAALRSKRFSRAFRRTASTALLETSRPPWKD